jgi:hypothetical protein
MKDYIINAFILENTNSLSDIFNYIKKRYMNTVELNKLKIEINCLVKKNIIFLDYNTHMYHLTKEGNIILNDNIYYYSRIIVRFFRKHSKIHKIYELKEKRLEQQSLRVFLLTNKEHKCILCYKHLPTCLLETAHIKPRHLLTNSEKKDKNCVELMCRYCHVLYDNGYLGVNNGLLNVSYFLNDKYDIEYVKEQVILNYNSKNNRYFEFHYKFIYLHL